MVDGGGDRILSKQLVLFPIIFICILIYGILPTQHVSCHIYFLQEEASHPDQLIISTLKRSETKKRFIDLYNNLNHKWT